MAVFAADLHEWVRDAFLHPGLVAAVLLSFRRRSRLDSDTEGDEKPSTSAPLPQTEFPGWGRRIKRSRVVRLPRVVVPGTREEKAAVERRKGKRRASPQSPLEGYSSASASGGEEGARGPRCLGVAVAAPEERLTKVAANPRAVSASSILVSGPIRRPPSKKMTKPELQAVESTLLDEKAKLLKEMEEWRRAVEALRADNRKLQIHLELPKIPDNVHAVLKDVLLPGLCQPISASSLRKDFIAIPDLNDPIPDC